MSTAADAKNSPSPLVLAAYSLQLEERTTRLVGLLAQAGVEVVVLKGLTFAHLLYPDGTRRRSADVDLLVPHRSLQAAGEVLLAAGYRRLTSVHDLSLNHAHTYVRRLDEASGLEAVDVHWNLHGSPVDPDLAWSALTAATLSVPTSDGDVRSLSAAGIALHTALHAARAGLADKRGEDLARAIAVLSDADWTGAAALARELDVEAAMALGLRLRPDGRALADRLGLTDDLPAPWLFSARDMPRGAVLVRELLRRPSAAQLRSVLRAMRTQASNLDPTPGPTTNRWHQLAARARYLRGVARDLPAALRSGREVHRHWDESGPRRDRRGRS